MTKHCKFCGAAPDSYLKCRKCPKDADKRGDTQIDEVEELDLYNLDQGGLEMDWGGDD